MEKVYDLITSRDLEYTKKLTALELMDHLAITWASTSAFTVEISRQYGYLLEQHQSTAEF